jgi:hypothetical protein
VDALSEATVTKEAVDLALKPVSERYAFTRLSAHIADSNIWWIDGAINPTGSKKTRKSKAEKKAAKNAAAAEAIKLGDEIMLIGGGGASNSRLTVIGVTATQVFYGANLPLSKGSYGKAWKLYDDRSSLWSQERIIKANASDIWPDYPTAYRCLNYRHHGFQLNKDKDTHWEHIVEQSFGRRTGTLVNNVKNIALTDGKFNLRLGKAFERSYSPGDIKGLPGTEGKPLREYLLTRPPDEQIQWKQGLYRLEGKSITLVVGPNGKYQVLK